MLKHKSIGSLAAAALFCMAVLLSPVASSADTSGSLTLTVVPSVTTASLGENVSYNYVITSTCNTTVSSLVLTDDKFGTISLPATSLNTGENITVSVARTVVSGDFPGPVTNTATITGIAADNTALSASASASVTLNQPVSTMTVGLSASASSAKAGDNITYTYTITNTGATALNSLALNDSRLGAVTLSSNSLATGASLTATKIYTVLPTDVSPLTSTATATATSSTGSTVTATSSAVSVTLTDTTDTGPTPPGDNWTKGDWLKFKGVPGKGILHAPGLLKPFNPNSHRGDWASDNNTGHPGNSNNDKGQGPVHMNGKDKNKGNGNH